MEVLTLFDYDSEVEHWKLNWKKYHSYINFITEDFKEKQRKIFELEWFTDDIELALLESIITVKLNDLFNNSLDANCTEFKTKLKYDYKKKEFTFFLRDNWEWKNAASTFYKKKSKDFIWWAWMWLDNIRLLSRDKFRIYLWENWSIVKVKINIDDFKHYMNLIIEWKAENPNTYDPQFFAKMDDLTKKTDNIIEKLKAEIWITDFIISKEDFEKWDFDQNISKEMIEEIKKLNITPNANFMHFYYLWTDLYYEQEDDKEDF